MTTEMMTGYRATMFDGEAGLNWLRPGWRGLRLYARKAKEAIKTGDTAFKADMIHRADQLLTLMSGMLDTGAGTTLGPVLMNIYASLHLNLLRANIDNDTAALDEFDQAIDKLMRDILQTSEVSAAA